MNEKQQPPADDFGGYPGDDVKPVASPVVHDDQEDEAIDDSVWDDDEAHIDPDLDIDLARPPTKGERRIIELTLREVGAAGVEELQETAELVRQLTAKTQGLFERIGKTLHDGVDEVFSSLAEVHDASDKDALAATSKAREAAHETVDELVQDLRGED